MSGKATDYIVKIEDSVIFQLIRPDIKDVVQKHIRDMKPSEGADAVVAASEGSSSSSSSAGSRHQVIVGIREGQ